MSNNLDALSDLFKTTSLGAPENAVGFVLWRVFHRYQREIDRALAPLDLTHLQFTTLALAAWHGRSGEPTTQAELARHGDIHRMQLSLMLKALEAKEMILRVPSPLDIRMKCVELTPTGITALRASLPAVIAVQKDMFGEQGRNGGDLLNALLCIDAGS